MSEPLTPEQVQHTIKKVNDFLSQYFDGWSVVGFHATTQQPMMFCSVSDAKTGHAIMSLLMTAAQSQMHLPSSPEDGKIADQ